MDGEIKTSGTRPSTFKQVGGTPHEVIVVRSDESAGSPRVEDYYRSPTEPSEASKEPRKVLLELDEASVDRIIRSLEAIAQRVSDSVHAAPDVHVHSPEVAAPDIRVQVDVPELRQPEIRVVIPQPKAPEVNVAPPEIKNEISVKTSLSDWGLKLFLWAILLCVFIQTFILLMITFYG